VRGRSERLLNETPPNDTCELQNCVSHRNAYVIFALCIIAVPSDLLLNESSFNKNSPLLGTAALAGAQANPLGYFRATGSDCHRWPCNKYAQGQDSSSVCLATFAVNDPFGYLNNDDDDDDEDIFALLTTIIQITEISGLASTLKHWTSITSNEIPF
jgi:hypothetical protein